MAKIIIADLYPADLETFIYDMKYLDYRSIFGGENDAFSLGLNFGIKFFEYVLVVYAIDTVSTLAKSFNTTK
ncbi:hypothetical protein [Cylindrospermum sp. FACHB-282]|uniref:hypothetical protein n=1 Tax=Cylindrospermum sp. FACHB-282 TaxID=2692794 RepID=UPI0016863BEE|nr:hypothetical protein [Cylindrospermum sp. FACHB-282]MBD2385180.1 hypothetical protein [Cylindrospermum sp. FACHB-282]